MSEKQISRFKIPDLKKLPEDIVEKILFVQNKSGFVPNFNPVTDLAEPVPVYNIVPTN